MAGAARHAPRFTGDLRYLSDSTPALEKDYTQQGDQRQGKQATSAAQGASSVWLLSGQCRFIRFFGWGWRSLWTGSRCGSGRQVQRGQGCSLFHHLVGSSIKNADDPATQRKSACQLRDCLAQPEIIIGQEGHLNGFHLVRVEGRVHPGAITQDKDL